MVRRLYTITKQTGKQLNFSFYKIYVLKQINTFDIFIVYYLNTHFIKLLSLSHNNRLKLLVIGRFVQ